MTDITGNDFRNFVEYSAAYNLSAVYLGDCSTSIVWKSTFSLAPDCEGNGCVGDLALYDPFGNSKPPPPHQKRFVKIVQTKRRFDMQNDDFSFPNEFYR